MCAETLRVALPDGGRLAVHVTPGVGEPLVCVPGGPLLSSDYLDDLGGLAADRRLALLDPRGTGGSDAPADPSACRCDRLADDLDVVREHLGLASVSLLAHSAGANVVYRYLERHAAHVDRLVLVTPSPRGVGVEVGFDERRAVLARRADQPWQPAALAALETIEAGAAMDADWVALEPTAFGRWDERERAYAERMDAEGRSDAAAVFGAEGAFDPAASRRALAGLDAPVLVVAGALDVGNPPTAMSALADLSPRSTLTCLPGAAHFPWRDDAAGFRSTVSAWLAERR